ncbi:hypothetical protein [Halocatena marina]|uniref:Uncharacterized protein n=1 Tax=Halocatena marina TaxID=2934937 RepID=A0ABD5YK54_9EURY|nr:hypothetical protein [Halocatena marina]
MDDAVINALGVFVVVGAGIIVAGLVMGQLRAALLLSVSVGATFGVMTYFLFRQGR